jgi:hypothetical protein
MRSVPFSLVAAFFALLPPSALSAAELVSNGGFTTGDFTDWTLFTTADGSLGSPPDPQVVMFNVTGGGAQDAAEFQVGQASPSAGQEGGGIRQDITTSAGLLNFSAAIASMTPTSTHNAQAGVFSVLLDGTVEATDALGFINGDQTLMGTLAFSTSVTAGTHELEILITRPYTTDAITPLQYVTDISATQGTVPETSTWAMMLLGFACLGYVGYRARSKRAALLS